MSKYSPQTYATIGLALLLSGCMAMGPDYQRPSLDLPASWPATAGASLSLADKERWWTISSDPFDLEVDRLVKVAFANNNDLVLASARVAEAEALLGVARSDQAPSIYGSASSDRNRSSEKSAFAQPGIPLKTTSHRAALNFSYEIDFWGKYQRASEAARAELLATEAARDTVRIALGCQVATTYFNLIALDQRLNTTIRAEKRAKESLALQQKRFEAGVASSFEYQQRVAEYESVRAQIPVIERERDMTERALAVLLGHSPREILAPKIEREAIAKTSNMPTLVPPGLPSSLLLRRPDLREAEQRLIASNARIGVARAAYFPSISLTGLFGGESASLSDLFSGPARIWRFAADLTQPIWGSNRIPFQIDAVEARNQQALAHYRSAIANAFREVQDAIVSQVKARDIREANQRRVSALEKSFALAKLRYENGVSSQLDVIDSERNLLLAELDHIETERQLRIALADIFKAIGGPSISVE